MSQTAIPLEFERYLQNQISVGDAPDMNEMIFAHIPGLDPSQPINRENGLPDVSLWVHQQDIDQVGKLGDNALAYSVVIPGTVAEFTFNAIYLRDKNVPNSCGMVVHKAEETKENGMASTKSLVQAYDGAAQIAGITVDASTWQIDYQARLKGIEEDHRLACLDNYGHTAFVDGFDVTQQADPNEYKVTPGVVYVGGLRAVLTGDVLKTISTKPNGLYIDVVRQGTALSEWRNKFSITASESELEDYVDGNGDKHYVAKLAGINADGSVVDWRVKGGLALAEPKSNAATDGDIDGESKELKHIKLAQLWRAFSNKVKSASTLVQGIVQLSNQITGDSEVKAATEKAVGTLYDEVKKRYGPDNPTPESQRTPVDVISTRQKGVLIRNTSNVEIVVCIGGYTNGLVRYVLVDGVKVGLIGPHGGAAGRTSISFPVKPNSEYIVDNGIIVAVWTEYQKVDV